MSTPMFANADYHTAATATIAKMQANDAGTDAAERAMTTLSIMNTVRDTAADGLPMATAANSTFFAQVGYALYTAETAEELEAALAGAWGAPIARLEVQVHASAHNLDGYRYTDLG